MQEFKFSQCVKHTIWVRHAFGIIAGSREEAIQKLEAFRNNEVVDSLDLTISHGGTQYLYDQETTLYPQQNREKSTMEIYDENDNLLLENGGEPTLKIFTEDDEDVCDN